MEEETTVSSDNITREGENYGREEYWVSPDVAAARAGETVDFSKHVAMEEETNTDA